MLELRILSSIAKVFPEEAPQPCNPRFAGFKNETISFQAAYRPIDPNSGDRPYLALEIDSPIKDAIHVRRVKVVPVRMPALPGTDDNYLNGKHAGLYPDALTEIPPHGLRIMPGRWETLWFDIEPAESIAAGCYDITIRLLNEGTRDLLAEATVHIRIIDANLPPQKLMHTKWFHSDCLASYYNVPVFSEEYWRITENFMACAVKRGINMILLPVHTPPLDTRPDTYRPAVQLVDVFRKDGKYTFGFEKLHRWMEMCNRVGVEYHEVAHLFTQWGANCAPQIIAETENGVERIFGWDTPATGEAYSEFLAAYLPALRKEFDALGISDRVVYHISDEPTEQHLDSYMAARNLALKYLDGCKIIDALSDVKFYLSGAVEHPVPANNHIEPFLAQNIPGLWTYYCIGQGKDVSNLFVSMPGARTRVLAAQLYKFDIEGFLQWGFNFYYSQYSDYLIDPWLDTDCDGFTPAGDAYQVYPGRSGEPVESIRLMIIHHAMQDLRAMQMLESLSDRQTVLDLIDEGIDPIRFASYPHEDAYVLGLRERINQEIEKRLG